MERRQLCVPAPSSPSAPPLAPAHPPSASRSLSRGGALDRRTSSRRRRRCASPSPAWSCPFPRSSFVPSSPSRSLSRTTYRVRHTGCVMLAGRRDPAHHGFHEGLDGELSPLGAPGHVGHRRRVADRLRGLDGPLREAAPRELLAQVGADDPHRARDVLHPGRPGAACAPGPARLARDTPRQIGGPVPRVHGLRRERAVPVREQLEPDLLPRRSGGWADVREHLRGLRGVGDVGVSRLHVQKTSRERRRERPHPRGPAVRRGQGSLRAG